LSWCLFCIRSIFHFLLITGNKIAVKYHAISYIPKNKLGSTIPTAEFKIRITFDLLQRLSNNPFFFNHRENAPKSSLTTKLTTENHSNLIFYCVNIMISFLLYNVKYSCYFAIFRLLRVVKKNTDF
jgi:hypothetical protein